MASKFKNTVPGKSVYGILMNNLELNAQARQGNLDPVFEHENLPSPPSISDMDQFRQGSKSDVLDCITKDSSTCAACTRCRCQNLRWCCRYSHAEAKRQKDIPGLCRINIHPISSLTVYVCR